MALSDYTPVISSIKLPGSNEKYYFKDAYAREVLEGLSQYSKFLGVTTTELTDGASTNPITISGESVTATTGCIVIYQSKEFIFGSDSKWAEFGDLSALINQLGDLAYEDTASTTYTPEGSVSVVLSASEQTVSFSGTPEGSVEISYDFESTQGLLVTISDFTLGEFLYSNFSDLSVGYLAAEDSYAYYRPAGTVTGSFSGTEGSVSVTGTTIGSVTVTFSESLTPDYTPAGTISAPSITVTPSTSNFYQVTSIGTLPSLSGGLLSMSMGTGADDETLIFSVPDISSMFNAGTLPSLASESTAFVTGISDVDYASNFVFTGTGVAVTPEFSGSTITCSGTFTPTGILKNLTFEGNDAEGLKAIVKEVDVFADKSICAQMPSITATFTGSSATYSGTFTPNVTVSSATFTGSTATITVSASE